MNILILSDKYPPDPGGLAVSTQRLARGLSRVGHSIWVSVLSNQLVAGCNQWIEDRGIFIHRLGIHPRPDDTLSQWFEQLVKLGHERSIHLIHAMYITQPAFVAVWAARTLGIASVISGRGNDLERTAFDPSKFSHILWALQNASAITAVTTELVSKTRALVPGREVFLVPNSVDSEVFTPGSPDPDLIKTLGLEEAVVIAFIGEARRKKGLTILLPAFAQINTLCQNKVVLLLVGGVRKDDAPILQVFMKQNPHLSVQVIPYVDHDHLPPYYQLTDILVLPSLRDGMPNTLLEGMASGKAIVASRVGGISDVLCRHGIEDGLLVPEGDVSALAEAMGKLCADPIVRDRLGKAARDTAIMHFSPQVEIEHNLQIYQTLVLDV